MTSPIRTLALLAAIGAPALQAQAVREAPSAQQRIARATAGLDLSQDQETKLDAVAARHTTAEPGATWRLAADVEAILTDAQVQSLAEKRAEHRTRRSERRGPSGEKAGRGRKAGGLLGLTEAQREQMKAGREAMRTQHEALRAQLQSGALSDAEYAERSRALRDEAKAAFDAALTDAQRRTMQEAAARREAERAAREAVLQITPAQKAAYEAARADAARSGERGAKAEVLTEDQRQIVAVHRALSMRQGRKGARVERPGRAVEGRKSVDR